MNKRISILAVICIIIVGVVVYISLSKQEEPMVCNHSINDFEVISLDEYICDEEEWIFIRLGTIEYEEFAKVFDIDKWIQEKEFNDLVGIYIYHSSKGKYSYVPVYAVCINKEDALKEGDYQEFYIPDDISLKRPKRDMPMEYTIIYARENDGSILQLGVGLLEAVYIEQTCLECKLNENESYDLIGYSCEIYPGEGVKAFSYATSLTSELKSTDDFVQEITDKEDTFISEEKPFVKHSYFVETLENGWQWNSEELTNASKISPIVVVHLNNGSGDGGKIDLSIDKLAFKVSQFKHYELENKITLSARYNNHAFIR